MYGFFRTSRQQIRGAELGLAQTIANVAKDPAFRGHSEEIAHDIIYDRKGARSLIGFNEELLACAGSSLQSRGEIQEHCARRLMEQVMEIIEPPSHAPGL